MPHDEGLSLAESIYYTLQKGGELKLHRVAKFTAILAQRLVDQDLLSKDQILAILDDVTSFDE